jgi:hypothetical protein
MKRKTITAKNWSRKQNMFPAFIFQAQICYMRRLLIPILLFFIVAAFARCSKCNCVDANVNFNFASFTTAELKQIEVKRYSPGSGFSRMLDSTHFKDEIDYRLVQQGDTVYLTPRSSGLSLSKECDWQIDLPVASRTFRITDIDVAHVRDDCSGKVQCINPVRSMRIDGALLQGPIISPVGFFCCRNKA